MVTKWCAECLRSILPVTVMFDCHVRLTSVTAICDYCVPHAMRL